MAVTYSKTQFTFPTNIYQHLLNIEAVNPIQVEPSNAPRRVEDLIHDTFDEIFDNLDCPITYAIHDNVGVWFDEKGVYKTILTENVDFTRVWSVFHVKWSEMPALHSIVFTQAHIDHVNAMSRGD